MLEPVRMYGYIPKLLNAYGRLELAESKLDILSPRHRAWPNSSRRRQRAANTASTSVRRSRAAGELPTKRPKPRSGQSIMSAVAG